MANVMFSGRLYFCLCQYHPWKLKGGQRWRWPWHWKWLNNAILEVADFTVTSLFCQNTWRYDSMTCTLTRESHGVNSSYLSKTCFESDVMSVTNLLSVLIRCDWCVCHLNFTTSCFPFEHEDEMWLKNRFLSCVLFRNSYFCPCLHSAHTAALSASGAGLQACLSPVGVYETGSCFSMWVSRL